MHENQVAVDADSVRAMLAEQFPRYADAAVVPLAASGTVNAIFRVGEDVTARFPLQPMDAEQAYAGLRREAEAMAEFADHAGVAAPRPLGLGRPGPLYPMPWSLQSWVEGEVATPGGLAASAEFALDIARLIAALRSVDVHGRRFDGAGRGGDLADHDGWMATCFDKSEALLDVARLRQLWARFRALPPGGAVVMSHKDLIPANLLIRDGRLAGVLDSGGFGPADPALDLVAAWHLFDRERRAIIRTRLDSSDVEWQRGAAWAFQQAMGLVWYYQASNPPMATLGRSTLARLLEDPALTGSA